MGADMRAAGRHLDTNTECWLVSVWCEDHDDRDFNSAGLSDRMGMFDFPPDIVKLADAAIPIHYGIARDSGAFNAFQYIDLRTFTAARLFLMAAALAGDSIDGSF